MSDLLNVEKSIESFSAEELKAFREWYVKFDADFWDAQIESDIKKGRLESLAQKALNEHRQNKTARL